MIWKISLPGRLAVGHRPLEASTGVRIPARQPKLEVSSDQRALETSDTHPV